LPNPSATPLSDQNREGTILGHKSIEMTRRYSHLSPKHKRAAVEALENALSKNGYQNGYLKDEKTDVL
ncbi:MAG: hypothetical protein QXH91_09200, partial [Candidatus Bathyarchaeia archaeon]